jgi:hypothetical protein
MSAVDPAAGAQRGGGMSLEEEFDDAYLINDSPLFRRWQTSVEFHEQLRDALDTPPPPCAWSGSHDRRDLSESGNDQELFPEVGKSLPPETAPWRAYPGPSTAILPWPMLC